ncbi:TetR family transcriptional regulator [Ferrovibrio sp.]|uniref:TetR family transcriptional regulator n=1 Tax=Ferrovibrio sp. TaxID=1917215 RepID=UPI003511BF74
MAKTAQRRTRRNADQDKTGQTGADPVDAMLDLVAAEGWRPVTLARIAEASGLSLADLYRQYGSKNDLLTAYARRIDAAMLAALGGGAVADTAEAAKDRLFEAVMARLDALAPRKPAIRALVRELPADPAALLCFLQGGLRRGIDWTLAAAGLEDPGLQGILRRKLLGLVYLDTLRVWLRDDSADLAATMAHLDRRLSRSIGLLRRRGFFSQLRDRFAQ